MDSTNESYHLPNATRGSYVVINVIQDLMDSNCSTSISFPDFERSVRNCIAADHNHETLIGERSPKSSNGLLPIHECGFWNEFGHSFENSSVEEFVR